MSIVIIAIYVYNWFTSEFPFFWVANDPCYPDLYTCMDQVWRVPICPDAINHPRVITMAPYWLAMYNCTNHPWWDCGSEGFKNIWMKLYISVYTSYRWYRSYIYIISVLWIHMDHIDDIDHMDHVGDIDWYGSWYTNDIRVVSPSFFQASRWRSSHCRDLAGADERQEIWLWLRITFGFMADITN